MKLSCITDQINQDITAACKVLHAHNIQNIEIHAVNHRTIEACEPSDIADIEQAISTYNMKVVALASTVFMMVPLYPDDRIQDFHPGFYKINGSIQEHFTHLKNVLKIANRLHCPVVRLFPFRAPINRTIVGDRVDQHEIAHHFKRASQLAKEHGVTLVVENCPYSHLPKGNMVLEVIKQVNSPNLRLLYDPGNSYRANKDRVPPHYLITSLLDELAEVLKYTHHIHVKDYKYVPDETKPFKHEIIGRGDVPIQAIIQYLNEHNYKHAISCEPELPYHKTLESLRTITSFINESQQKAIT